MENNQKWPMNDPPVEMMDDESNQESQEAESPAVKTCKSKVMQYFVDIPGDPDYLRCLLCANTAPNSTSNRVGVLRRRAQSSNFHMHMKTVHKMICVGGDYYHMHDPALGDVILESRNKPRVFQFYRQITQDPEVFQCIYCDPTYGKGSIRAKNMKTSNLIQHLRSMHKVDSSVDPVPDLSASMEGNLFAGTSGDWKDEKLQSANSKEESVFSLSTSPSVDGQMVKEEEPDEVHFMPAEQRRPNKRPYSTSSTEHYLPPRTLPSPILPSYETQIVAQPPMTSTASIPGLSSEASPEKKPKLLLEGNARVSVLRDRVQQSLEMTDRLTRGSDEAYDRLMSAMNRVLMVAVKNIGDASSSTNVESLYTTLLQCEPELNDSFKDAALVSFAKSFAVTMEKLLL